MVSTTTKSKSKSKSEESFNFSNYEDNISDPLDDHQQNDNPIENKEWNELENKLNDQISRDWTDYFKQELPQLIIDLEEIKQQNKIPFIQRWKNRLFHREAYKNQQKDLNRWIKLKNKKSKKKYWVSTDTITHRDVRAVIKHQVHRKKNVLIMSGTHGSKCGRFAPDEFTRNRTVAFGTDERHPNPQQDPRFFNEDLGLAEALPNVQIIDVYNYMRNIYLQSRDRVNADQYFSNILRMKDQDVYVFAWCHSVTTQTMLNAIRS